MQLSGCGSTNYNLQHNTHIDSNSLQQSKTVAIEKNTIKATTVNNANNEYQIKGKRYKVLNTAKNYRQVGTASWYGKKFQGKVTSSNERYNLHGMTAASPILPLHTYVKVTNLNNGKQVIVKVNDRGPFLHNRILDLSYAAAKKLGFSHQGLARVEVASIDASNPLDTIAINNTNTPLEF